MMKKAGIFTAIAVLAGIFTAGCGQAKLPESFSEEEVKKEAEKSIALFNERDYAGLIEMGSEAVSYTHLSFSLNLRFDSLTL